MRNPLRRRMALTAERLTAAAGPLSNTHITLAGVGMSGTALRWKRRLAGLITLGAVAAVAAAAWLQTHRGATPPPVKPEPVKVLRPEPTAVAPGVYLLGRTAPAAAYAVDGSDGLVLIDSG